jgi:APA family basic amino acid/polyamine antiporter
VLIPGFFTDTFFADLGALYVFGSLLCFALAHAAIIALRFKQPDAPRPFKLNWNIRFKDRALPVTAILGFIATAVIWVVVVIIQPYSRYVGLLWMAVGLIIYYVYRKTQKMSLTHSDIEPASQIHP